MIESSAISNRTKEINYLFPLYLYPSTSLEVGSHRQANLDAGFAAAISAALSLDYISDGVGDLKATFGPEDVFHYLYAVLHSPEYRRRYAGFLKSDFPRIPLTGKRALFAALAGLGQRLAALHLMKDEGADPPAFPHPGDNRVDQVRYAAPASTSDRGRVWINQDQCFDGVPPGTWVFSIGGYRPAEKWLKDRKSRTLSFDDIAHYRRICAALTETRRTMVRAVLPRRVALDCSRPLLL